jgi:hypothetical protein
MSVTLLLFCFCFFAELENVIVPDNAPLSSILSLKDEMKEKNFLMKEVSSLLACDFGRFI